VQCNLESENIILAGFKKFPWKGKKMYTTIHTFLTGIPEHELKISGIVVYI
jgi:hypothetical protein